MESYVGSRQEIKTLQYKTIPLTKLVLSNCLNCLDIPNAYSPKALQNFSEVLLEKQLLASASLTLL